MATYILSSIFLSILVVGHVGFAMEPLLLQQDEHKEDAKLQKKIAEFPAAYDVLIPDDVQRVIASYMMQDFLWDTAREIRQNQQVGDCLHGRLRLAEISHNDKWLITVDEAKKNTAYVWSMATAQLLHKLEHHTDIISCLKICADDTYVITGSKDGTTIVWNIATGTSKWILGKSLGTVKSIAMDPDNIYVATYSELRNMDKLAQIWDMQTGDLLCSVDNEEECCFSSLLIVRKRGQLATASCGAVFKLWDMKTGALVRKLSEHIGTMYHSDMILTSDERYLIFPSGNKIHVWDLEVNKGWTAFGTYEIPVRSLFASLDQTKLLIMTDNGFIEGYDMTGQLLHCRAFGHMGHPELAFAFDGHGKKFLRSTFVSSVEVYDVETARELYRLKGHENEIKVVKVNSDGTQVVTGSRDKTTRIWSLKKSSARMWLENEVLPFQANLIARAYIGNKKIQKFEIAFGTDDMLIWVSLPSHVRDYLNLYLNVVLIPRLEQNHQ